MSSNFILATKEEKLLADLLKDGAKQHNEIVQELKRHNVSESQVNRLLRRSEGRIVFRVTRGDGKVFYRLNVFPRRALLFFALADQIPKDWETGEAFMEIKNEVLRSYPGVTFEDTLRKWRTYIKQTKPHMKGISGLLKFFEKADIR